MQCSGKGVEGSPPAGKDCWAQCGHGDFQSSKSTRPEYIIIIKEAERHTLYVCAGSKTNLLHSEKVREDFSNALALNDISIHLNWYFWPWVHGTCWPWKERKT